MCGFWDVHKRTEAASRAWYENLTTFLLGCGFIQGKADACLFVTIDNDDLMIVLIYFDDMLVFGTDDGALAAFKLEVENTYEVNNFDEMNYFLGLELQWSAAGDEVRVCQNKCASTILKRCGMSKRHSCSTPMEENYRNQLNVLVLKDIGVVMDEIVVMEDNQGAQHLAESKGVTQRSRHIDAKYHWLKEKVRDVLVYVRYCPTSEMVADHFTKPLGKTKFEYFLGVRRVGGLGDHQQATN
ncbi:unnamed protein product [Phytophthora fragariaefolia]|uniref:Unnamed protein product n=1 Tax=Phytophthora fragariaefolia TaxID=1490495 RepID=A0A9W6Y2V6_9STRA|nr:unnamed protein product [Phytophthora fragariaefolia]